MIIRSVYLGELKESIELCERSILGLEMGFITENDYKAKMYSHVEINFITHMITLVVCESLRIQVTQHNIDSLPKMYKYLEEKIEINPTNDSIKKHALAYIQTIGFR